MHIVQKLVSIVNVKNVIVQPVTKERNNDRTSSTWYELKELKKQKLKAKEQLNETKQKL